MGKAALYARVSTADQSADGQLERLESWAESEGHWVVIKAVETASGRDANRPEMARVVGAARARRVDVVACCKVDRWARSVQHLARSVDQITERGVTWIAVDQGLKVDPRDPTSNLLKNLLGAVAEWEADIISERTKEGLEARRAQGVQLGRPAKPCGVCGGEREGRLYALVGGVKTSVCGSCKDMNPAKRRALAAEGSNG